MRDKETDMGLSGSILEPAPPPRLSLQPFVNSTSNKVSLLSNDHLSSAPMSVVHSTFSELTNHFARPVEFPSFTRISSYQQGKFQSRRLLVLGGVDGFTHT